MKALVSETYGPLDTLTMTDVPAPEAGQGQVLLRTEAVAVNGLDPKLVTGAMQEIMQVPHPFVPGVDVAGVVEAVGPGVRGYSVGDRVIAALGAPFGGMAEYVVTHESPRMAPRPEGLDAVHGAALVTPAMTAQTVLDAARLQPDETVLVVGASGGVGSIAVQLARRAARAVYATGHAEDESFVLGLGADALIDYRSVDVAQEAHRLANGGVDVVFDVAQAGQALASSAAAARPGGRLFSVLGGPPAFDRDVSATYLASEFPEGGLARMAQQVAEGRVQVPIGATYPFADARTALVDFTSRHVVGKYVVTLTS